MDGGVRTPICTSGRWLLKAEGLLRLQGSQLGIFGALSDTGARFFFSEYFDYPHLFIIIPPLLHTHIHSSPVHVMRFSISRFSHHIWDPLFRGNTDLDNRDKAFNSSTKR